MICDHCGAVSTGTLLGYPVLVHEDGCPNAPKLLAGDVVVLLAALPTKRYLCSYCGAQWDKAGEAEHALDCPASPLTN